jgi:lipopolysaccharide export LptBFGC system permease protein LptF
MAKDPAAPSASTMIEQGQMNSSPPDTDRPSRENRQPPVHRSSRSIMIYIAVEILKVFLLTFVTFELIYGSIVAIQVIRDYSFGLVMILPILKSTFAYELYIAIPVGLLFATSLVYGRLVADREISAFRSLGFSNLELAATPAVLGIVLSIVCFFINGWSVPEARKAKENVDSLILGQLQYLGEGWNKKLSLGKRSSNTLLIKNYKGTRLNDIIVVIEDAEEFDWKGIGEVTSRSFPFVLRARQGDVMTDAKEGSGIFLELRDVTVLIDQGFIDKGAEDGPQGNFMHRFHLARYRLGIRPKEKSGVPKAKELTHPELLAIIQEKNQALEEALLPPVDQTKAGDARNGYRRGTKELHRRITFSIVCLAFALMSVMVALTLDSTNRFTPFFVSVVVSFLVFFPLEEVGSKLVDNNGSAWFFVHIGIYTLAAMTVIMWLRLEKRWPMYWPRRRKARRANSEGD